MLSSRLIILRTASEISYILLLLTTIAAVGLSCFALLSQAVRTSRSQSWAKNINALVIGASYAIVVTPTFAYSRCIPMKCLCPQLVVSLLYCAKRRIAVRLKLQRISKAERTIGRADLPDVCIALPPVVFRRCSFALQSVHQYIAQEYVRACLVSYESLPKDVHHEGWGRPGKLSPERVCDFRF